MRDRGKRVEAPKAPRRRHFGASLFRPDDRTLLLNVSLESTS